ncbi:hypothetical protein SRRS_50150 [Sporomusa rhizae]|uniref:DUF3794 domain-containing protein n=1 Tax=Sporomusa rhizae TaxID=357999 RepID=UPI00352A929E
MRYCDKDPAKENAAIDYVDCRVMGTFENPMRSDSKDRTQLLTINGICPREKLEDFLDDGRIRRWTELVVPEVLCIPSYKPDIEQIISISLVVEIICERVINTPFKTNNPRLSPPIFNQEGTAITGKKLLVEGVLRQKIVYATIETQSVHAVHFDTPFSAFIVLEPQDSSAKKFKVDVCIEDVFVTDITSRTIIKNVTLVIRALPFVR